jgi:flagellar hook-associated protein 2
MDLGVSGLASGFDWKSFIEQMADVQRAPQKRLITEQYSLQEENNAYSSLKTQLTTFQARIDALKEASLYTARSTKVGDDTVATATAADGAATGSYLFNFIQRATSASMQGTADAGQKLSQTDDVSGVTLGNAGFSTAVTNGIFTVNGKRITIATSDTLQQVFDKINAATGGDVTATYSSANDKVTFTSGSGTPIVMGSATDTTNFLQVARLYNNGTASTSSYGPLGGVKLAGSMSSANLATAVTDGGAGAGEFSINGVSIKYNATSDSVQNVLDRINSSDAGVTATYDAINDRFQLINKNTGDMGIALEDVTGNFLTATGLAGGTLQAGKNLIYTVNGGPQQYSQSNTISEASSGIAGLSVTALAESATTTVTVDSDTSKVKTAINDFLSEYNKLQSTIDSQTASTTAANGKVTASPLSGDTLANELASKLRSIAVNVVGGLTGSYTRLEALGIDSNGDDNSLSLKDSEKLDAALANNPAQVQALFANTTNGIAVQFSDLLEKTIGDDGTLIAKQDQLTKQSSDIDDQISVLEKSVQATKAQLTSSFVAMEQAQANINQQLAYLQKTFK